MKSILLVLITILSTNVFLIDEIPTSNEILMQVSEEEKVNQIQPTVTRLISLIISLNVPGRFRRVNFLSLFRNRCLADRLGRLPTFPYYYEDKNQGT